MFRWMVILGCPLLLLAALVQADSSPDPSTQPAAHKAVVPPGYHVVTSGDRAAFCLPADDDWVKSALTSVPPTTRPSTMPSDLVSAANQHRADLTSQITGDFALADPKVVDAFFDNDLLTGLQKMSAMKLNVYYFPINHEDLISLLVGGWSDPRFHFNRYANEVGYSPFFHLSALQPMDDLIWWVPLQGGDSTATRRDALEAQVKTLEALLTGDISLFTQNQAEHLLEIFIHKTVFVPLNLPARLQWIDFGACNLFAVKYCSQITGMSRQYWTEQLIGRPGEPRPFLAIDLTNTLDPSKIRPEYLAQYDEMLLPKGALVIQTLLSKSGDSALAKVLPAWRVHPPQTAQDLIQSVQAATGVDLTSVMRPDYSSPAQ
jgi:hypothetical protein